MKTNSGLAVATGPPTNVMPPVVGLIEKALISLLPFETTYKNLPVGSAIAPLALVPATTVPAEVKAPVDELIEYAETSCVA